MNSKKLLDKVRDETFIEIGVLHPYAIMSPPTQGDADLRGRSLWLVIDRPVRSVVNIIQQDIHLKELGTE